MVVGLVAILLVVGPAPADPGDLTATPMQGVSIRTLDDLVTLSAPQLDQLYRQAGPGAVPLGKVVGRALFPESRFPKARSNATKFVWQGKVFDPATSTATNRFFGLKAIQGKVYYGPSWLDGQPSMILDYEETSRIYDDYRDEIRQVAPDLFLGLMYDRTVSPPALKMYFGFRTSTP